MNDLFLTIGIIVAILILFQIVLPKAGLST
ncbi:hypothetical protein MNBD_NITROSPIRAE02-1051 [hydrothermal vent metagenome]|uniref:Uncharacterized protein n=1 Tax=hydrothermal vent metagenome TaxID=652676 RepID=A0A3B1DRG4_9ZZZZ